MGPRGWAEPGLESAMILPFLISILSAVSARMSSRMRFGYSKLGLQCFTQGWAS
jgi:hypothetical protein